MLRSNSSAPWTGVPLSVDFSRPEHYIVFLFQLLFASCTVLVAGSVAVSILATRALRLQNRFLFMLNTSVCDTLVGLSVYYLGLFDVSEGYPSRNGTLNFLPSLLGVNMLTFMFAQFDRYFAVCHPFLYTRYFTRRLVICVNIYSWVQVFSQATILYLIPLSMAFQMYAFSMVYLQLIVLTKVAMTIKLYIVAKSQMQREPPGPERESNKESLRMIVFVVISFLILWSPSIVNIPMRLFGRGVTFHNEATNLFAIMARGSALVTPAVYIWGSAALRRALLRVVWGRLCPCCRRREEGETPAALRDNRVQQQRFPTDNTNK
ncbi:unnamed protein product [Knipowitschia caucasica]|uniref:G-protein coupled receptors family 1 profile domain-containing protein n=1 Tax=Knipowitschia caucasica TaxID=637954 RepID=A0AAV2MPC8_KNICA